jgi:hypothetical protein
MVFPFAAPGTAFLASTGHLVDRGPSPTLGFLFAQPPLLVTFFDVFGLALLLVRIAGFITAWHKVFWVEWFIFSQ